MNPVCAAELSARLDEVDIVLRTASCSAARFDADEISRLTARVRHQQRLLDGVLTAVAARSANLSQQGSGPGADQVLIGTGEVTARQSRAEVARAGVADSFPALGDALRQGDTSGAHLDAVARVVDNLSNEERSALQRRGEELAEHATRLPPETFGRRLRALVDAEVRRDGGLARLETQRANSQLRWWQDAATGMGHLRAELDPVRWEQVVATLDAHMRRAATASTGVTKLDEHLAADALVEVITAGASGNGRQVGAHLSVVVDAKTMLSGYHEASIHETAAGSPVPRETFDRLACDALIRRVSTDERGVPVDVGRRYRTATPEQWAALHALYRRCSWAGCDRPITWCQAHHVITWTADHGPTDLDNLVPLCSAHHHQAHEGGWRLRLHPDRRLDLFQPDGTLWATTQPDRGPTADPAVAAGRGSLGGVP